MLEPDTTMKIVYEVIDRDGRVARITMRYPFSTPLNTLISIANDFVSTFSSLSDATIQGWKMFWHVRETDDLSADPDSDIYRKVTLFYRNEVYFEEITVPSARETLFENEGPYAVVRVDSTNPALLPWTVDAATTLASVSTPEGEPFPTAFVVGGLVL